MELAIKLGHDAEEISPAEDRPDDPDDPQVREAETLEQVSEQVKDLLNTHEEADKEGSASSQHFIETGVRLPMDFELGITAQAWRSELDDVPVVQIDTEAGAGRMRVNLNEAPIYDGDPEVGTSDIIRLAALSFLHSDDSFTKSALALLADALGVPRGDVEALG